jgi:uncharacterized tellurite resistance protein B-like protein
MLTKLRELLDGLTDDAAGEADEADALQLAAATLMVELTRADARVDENELEAIGSALQAAYDLSVEQRDALLAAADQEADSAVSLHDFTFTLNNALSERQKYTFIEHLWRVAYADGRIDRYEDHFIRKVADLLYMPHSQFIKAKHSAVEN